MSNGSSGCDDQLIKALTAAYAARSKLFHEGVRSSSIDLLIAEIDALDSASLRWDLDNLGISTTSWKKVKDSGAVPEQVFVHPDVIVKNPSLIAYYRNMATISNKGMSQLLFSTNGYEKGSGRQIGRDRAHELSRVLNEIISNVIDSVADYDVQVSRKAILAEIGAQLQGTWANLIGQGATNQVEQIIRDHIEREDRGSRIKSGEYYLSNGWKIIFGGSVQKFSHFR